MVVELMLPDVLLLHQAEAIPEHLYRSLAVHLGCVHHSVQSHDVLIAHDLRAWVDGRILERSELDHVNRVPDALDMSMFHVGLVNDGALVDVCTRDLSLTERVAVMHLMEWCLGMALDRRDVHFSLLKVGEVRRDGIATA